MKKPAFLSLILSLILLFSCGIGFSENKFSSLTSDIISNEPGKEGELRGKLFLKGDKIRIEWDASGLYKNLSADRRKSLAGYGTVYITDGKKSYLYIPSENKAMVVSMALVKQQVPDPEGIKNNFQHVGNEIIDGRMCGIYRCPDSALQAQEWIASDINFVVKSSTAKQVTLYKNIESNIALDEKIFELPEGVRLVKDVLSED